jgi:hypothetical protein
MTTDDPAGAARVCLAALPPGVLLRYAQDRMQASIIAARSPTAPAGTSTISNPRRRYSDS